MSDLSISRRRRGRAVTAVARSALAIVGVVTVFACGACSSDPDPEPTTTQSTVIATPSVSPTTPSSTTVSPPSPTSESAVPTQASGPWPPGSTPEEQEAAKGAIAAFEGYTQVLTAAQQNPNQPDWESQFARYLAEPALGERGRVISSLAMGGAHQVGVAKYEDIRTTVVDEDSATVVACVDTTDVIVVDQNGAELPIPVGPKRMLVSAQVEERAASGWLVTEITSAGDAPC